MAADTVAAVEATVDLDEVLGWYAGAMAELDTAVPAPAGPPGGLYDNELFTTGRGCARWSTYRSPSRYTRAGACTRLLCPRRSWRWPHTRATTTR